MGGIKKGYKILAPPKDHKKVHACLCIYTHYIFTPLLWISWGCLESGLVTNHPNRIHCNPWTKLVRYIIISNTLLSMWLIALWTHFFFNKLMYTWIMISGCFFPNGSLGHGRRGPPRKSTSVRVSIHILLFDVAKVDWFG